MNAAFVPRSIRAAMLASLLAGVALPVRAEEPSVPERPAGSVAGAPPTKACRLEAGGLPTAMPQDQHAKTAFAQDLLAALAGDGKANVAVSPFGVTAVLAALDLGADAKMKAAIARGRAASNCI